MTPVASEAKYTSSLSERTQKIWPQRWTMGGQVPAASVWCQASDTSLRGFCLGLKNQAEM